MFGERLWPRPVGAFYDYYQLRTAIWYFNDHNRWLGMNHDNGVDSRARLLRLGTYYLRTFVHHELKGHDGEAMENLFNVTMKLALLMERNPHGECIYPPTPNIEGEEWAVKRRKRYSR